MPNKVQSAINPKDFTLNFRVFIFWMIFALLLHAIASIFSAGFYHSDEHFQILEFINYKMGLSPASALPIEFSERIRPWFQPAIYLAIIQPFLWLGDHNPFHWSLAIRSVSAFIGWLSLCGLALLSQIWIENPKLRRASVILCATLWFLPALHARHSSENLSGSVFYITLSLLFLSERWLQKGFSSSRELASIAKVSLLFLTIGFLFGISFELRYQVGFLVAGVYAYWLYFRRTQKTGLFLMGLGTIAAIALGVIIDHWGYGTWTFAPWNYFHYNLVLNHVSDVDTHPLWDFFRTSFTETFPPLGTVLLSCCVLGWIAKPRHPLTWASLPLFAIHTLIGHKELRFLFPIAHAAPLLMVQFLDTPKFNLLKVLVSSFTGKVIIKILFAINLVALLACTFIPVWMPIRFFQQLYPVAESQHDKGYANLLIYYKDKNPFDILGLPFNFYRPPNTLLEPLSSIQELQGKADHSAQPVWFFENNSEVLPPQCRLKIASLPLTVSQILHSENFEGWTQGLARRVTNWTLYQCEPTEGLPGAAAPQ